MPGRRFTVSRRLHVGYGWLCGDVNAHCLDTIVSPQLDTVAAETVSFIRLLRGPLKCVTRISRFGLFAPVAIKHHVPVATPGFFVGAGTHARRDALSRGVVPVEIERRRAARLSRAHAIEL